MSEWQTIETAPSDGQIIIIWGGRYSNPDVAKADGVWWRTMRATGSATVPTHWQPLPAPPSSAVIDDRSAADANSHGEVNQ